MEIETVRRILLMINARISKANDALGVNPTEFDAGKIQALAELGAHLQEWVEYTASYEED